jgi:polyketide biosynthesis enoyl-CoA hydratase PksH
VTALGVPPGSVPGDVVLRLHLDEGSSGPVHLTGALIATMKARIAVSHDARVIALQGRQGSFCAGLDLERISDPSTVFGARDIMAFAELLDALRFAPQPVVALVDGSALGGGVGLAAAADLVIASPRASFALPETLMGVVPAAIFPHVARRMGVQRAMLMALGAPALDAQAAKSAGLVDVISDQPEATAASYASRFVRTDAGAIGALKALVSKHYIEPLGYREAAASVFAELLRSDSTRNRIARFAQGRAPWEEP